MANTERAIAFVMRQEDATLSGVITNRPMDRGGLTRFGLTARWHPELAGKSFFAVAAIDNGKLIPRMKASEAFTLAEQTYETEYANPLGLASISSQGLATALLSFAVLEGTREAVTLFQRAIIAVTAPPAELDVDGIIGPKTLALANTADTGKLLRAFVSFAESFFEHLAAVVPSQRANLGGWMNRANALLAIPIQSTAQPEPEAEAV